MSSKKSPASKIAIFLGLGLGFSGELAGSAWVGWWIGKSWQMRGGPASAPGLVAMGFVIAAITHITWLLWRLSNRQNTDGEEIS